MNWFMWSQPTKHPPTMSFGARSSLAKLPPYPKPPFQLSIHISRPPDGIHRAGLLKESPYFLKPGWAEDSAELSGRTTKWCSGQWFSIARISTTLWDSNPKEQKLTFRLVQTPICTERALSPI